MKTSQSTPKKSVVFIDSRVSNYQTFVDGLGDDTQWVLLHADQDGVLQMQAALATYSAVGESKIGLNLDRFQRQRRRAGSGRPIRHNSPHALQ